MTSDRFVVLSPQGPFDTTTEDHIVYGEQYPALVAGQLYTGSTRVSETTKAGFFSKHVDGKTTGTIDLQATRAVRQAGGLRRPRCYFAYADLPMSLSNISDQVWLITSRQTLPDLRKEKPVCCLKRRACPGYVWVEDAVDEADAWALVWVLVGKLYVDLPEAALEWCFDWSVVSKKNTLEVIDDVSLLSSGPLKRGQYVAQTCAST
ncbi:Uu.00g045240.m01.CDS01 [Anthostomella pinea]|uniref:Uu.00g045240.m01.CDS01 n=1 Tax=Anthostomella pinea TaxID=933095 RepID=A0AAI8VC47_9PEZI|nr:Uu.00g045240.m01.CDS01 [Anthostomella pinea]